MPSLAFGEYEVLARLATGGAANIFLARHPAARNPERRLLCLKTLLPERARDRDFVDMFLDEARLAARLKHPNCVELYGFGKADLTYYLAMEYISGETLWGLLTTVAELRRPLPPPVVASIIASALDGLHAAHELADEEGRSYQVVHRDISPQNIMVTYDGRIKLLDFGIAKAETGRQATATGIVKGKFSYMSPEQITGGALDRRSDLYSIGIVLFECLVSRRLYKADRPEDIARMMLERRPPRLSEVQADMPPELEEICATALARHAKSRFSTAAEMSAALRRYLEREGTPIGPALPAKLMEERFADRLEARAAMTRALSSGRYEESEMLEMLGASPVLELDFRPAFSADETMGDADSLSESEPSFGSRAGQLAPGFRLEVERSPSSVPSPLVRDVPAMKLPRTTSHGLHLGGAQTRPESASAPTLFDPARTNSEQTDESRAEAPLTQVTLEVVHGVGEGEGSAEVSEEFDEDTEARWAEPAAESASETPAAETPALSSQPEPARGESLSRAASFETDEVTSDTSPSHARAEKPSSVKIVGGPREVGAGVVVTPVEPPAAAFLAPLLATSSPPLVAPTPRPSLGPASVPAGWAGAPSPRLPGLGLPGSKVWIVSAFVLGLALGLFFGFLLGRF